MGANVLEDVITKRDALKDAMANTNVGVRRKAVEKKVENDSPPPADDPSKPTKYNTPRKPGESFDAYADRLTTLQKAAKAGK